MNDKTDTNEIQPECWSDKWQREHGRPPTVAEWAHNWQLELGRPPTKEETERWLMDEWDDYVWPDWWPD